MYVALILHCSSYISKIVWWLPLFDFGIFCHLLRLMGICRVEAPSGYLKSFVLSFIFFLFFSFSFVFLFCSSFSFFSLSAAPKAPGPLDIVHPCLPVATPLRSKYGEGVQPPLWNKITFFYWLLLSFLDPNLFSFLMLNYSF